MYDEEMAYIVNDVKFDWVAFLSILHSEVEPLSVTLSIDIVLH